MKKVNFKNLSNDEILTRDELKRISGGNGSGSGEKCNCNTKAECPPVEGKPQGCMAGCERSNGKSGHCAWDGTAA